MASVATAIRKKIESGRRDRVWTYQDFLAFPALSVAKTLSRMASGGSIRRVRKGVYYRPRTTRFGETKPRVDDVLAHLFRDRHVEWKPSGLGVWNALGLTPQVAAVPTVAVERPVRIKVPFPLVRIRVANVQGVSLEERGVLDALRNLRGIPDAEPVDSMRRIVALCKDGKVSFERLARIARSEPPRVRALLGLIGTLLGRDKAELEALRGTLNQTTHFKLGLAESFPEASEWNIR